MGSKVIADGAALPTGDAELFLVLNNLRGAEEVDGKHEERKRSEQQVVDSKCRTSRHRLVFKN